MREDHWWERVFNEASSNVDVQKSVNGKIAIERIDKAGVEITNKSFSLKKLRESNTSLQYGNFLKSATLLANIGKEEEIDGHLSTVDIEIKPLNVLSDEDLFKACGGRTAHKGARHGLNLTGKLQRIADQEKILLEKMKQTANRHEVFREPSTKRHKKNPLADLNSSKDDTSDDNRLPVDTESDYILKQSHKRKKRDRQAELQLVAQISTIGLETGEKFTIEEEFERPTEHEEDEPQRDGTPLRKKKKSKRAADNLAIIEESDQQETPKRKKKKGKRKLDEDDETMAECANKYLKAPAIAKTSKKVKLNDSYEASEDEDDVVDKINAEQEEIRQLAKGKKKSRKSEKKKEKTRAKKTSKYLANTAL